MSTQPKELPADFSFLALPDEELANYDPQNLVVKAPDAPAGEGTAPTADPAATDTATGENDANDTAPSTATDKDTAKGAAGDTPAVDEAPAAGIVDPHKAAGEVKPADSAGSKKVETPPEPKPVEAAADPKKDAAAVNYESEYQKLLAPFKANGKDFQVQNVDEAIQLMQMGANYNKKMAALKPNMMLLKLLENNGLLSEEKIGYLIDLHNKVPGAVNKLVKDSGLDPVTDLDAEKASGYTPTKRTVDAREVELDEVLDSIQDSPSYQRTVDAVSKWDAKSKQAIADSPQLLRTIDEHMNRGVYDLISTEMERARMFGRLAGLSFVDAYKQVGDEINARGGFNHLGQPQGQVNKPGGAILVPPKSSKVDEDAAKNQKRAAAPTQVAAPAVAPVAKNYLAMSDEEFMKHARAAV